MPKPDYDHLSHRCLAESVTEAMGYAPNTHGHYELWTKGLADSDRFAMVAMHWLRKFTEERHGKTLVSLMMTAEYDDEGYSEEPFACMVTLWETDDDATEEVREELYSAGKTPFEAVGRTLLKTVAYLSDSIAPPRITAPVI